MRSLNHHTPLLCPAINCIRRRHPSRRANPDLLAKKLRDGCGDHRQRLGRDPL